MLNEQDWNERIRYERLKRGLSQEEAAEQWEVSSRTVRGWEAGQHVPSCTSRQRLSSFCERSIEELGLLNSSPISKK